MKYARKCTECGSGMNNGYVIGGGGEYYCTDECLHKNVTPLDWAELTEDEDSDSYWTEWEDEDDFQYEEDENGNLIEIEDEDDEPETFTFKLQQKVTTWMETKFEIEATSLEEARQKAIEFHKQGNTASIGWDEIMDAQEEMSVDENDGQPTEELFGEDGHCIWENSKEGTDEG